MSPSHAGRRALVLAHEPDGPAGQVEVRLRERGIEVDTHIITSDYEQPQDFVAWPSFADYDLVVLMGSVRSLAAKDDISAWIHRELDDIKAAQGADQPMLGVCFGGQLLAEALGGSVEVAPVTEIGWFEIEPVDDAPAAVTAGPWFEWHHDRFDAPADAQVLARNDNATQLFRIGRSVGTQFHPEVDVAHVKGFLDDAPEDYLTANSIDPQTMLDVMAEMEAGNTARCHALVDWYLDEVAFPQAG